MVKEILIILLAFNFLVVQEGFAAVSPPQSQSYKVESQYEGADGTIYYKTQQMEVISMGPASGDQIEPQKDIHVDKRPFAERKDFVNNETYNESPFLDSRPFAERKDFVSLQEGKSNPTIEWIVGKTSTDITFAVVSNELIAYKTTTYLIAMKPKIQEQTNTQKNSLPTDWVV